MGKKKKLVPQSMIDAAPAMLAELEEIYQWHVREKIPLRQQELDSIKKLIQRAKGQE